MGDIAGPGSVQISRQIHHVTRRLIYGRGFGPCFFGPGPWCRPGP